MVNDVELQGIVILALSLSFVYLAWKIRHIEHTLYCPNCGLVGTERNL